jgi:hypothetical protein
MGYPYTVVWRSVILFARKSLPSIIFWTPELKSLIYALFNVGIRADEKIPELVYEAVKDND